MPGNEKRGITVKVDAGLHAEIRSYLEAHGMTMGEFISLAAENTLHPKFQVKESATMENARTLAFQVPEELFQRIKDYLRRNGMTQKQFVIGLIEEELERDEALHQNAENGAQEPADEGEEAEEDPDPVDEPAEDVDDSEGISGEEAEEGVDPTDESSEDVDDSEGISGEEAEEGVDPMDEPAEDVDGSEGVSSEETEEGTDPAEDFLNGDDGEAVDNGESEDFGQAM